MAKKKAETVMEPDVVAAEMTEAEHGDAVELACCVSDDSDDSDISEYCPDNDSAETCSETEAEHDLRILVIAQDIKSNPQRYMAARAIAGSNYI